MEESHLGGNIPSCMRISSTEFLLLSLTSNPMTFAWTASDITIRLFAGMGSQRLAFKLHRSNYYCAPVGNLMGGVLKMRGRLINPTHALSVESILDI
jgi:hypothetical protein